LMDLTKSKRQTTLPWSFLGYVAIELLIEYLLYVMLMSVLS
jgi:hypothetical protein